MTHETIQQDQQPLSDGSPKALTASARLAEALQIDSEEGWQSLAVCSQTDPEAFFPEKNSKGRDAKKVCAGCEVRVECLEYALDNDERFGIWGGLTEGERRKLRGED